MDRDLFLHMIVSIGAILLFSMPLSMPHAIADKPSEALKPSSTTLDKVDVKNRLKTDLKKPKQEYVELMAKLIEHEARGESFEGKLAVGNVLLNRCFGDKKLMQREAFRKNAFTGFEKAYPYIKPSSESVRAAKSVLNGTRIVSRGTRYFLNRKTATNHWIERNCKLEKKIGNHTFYSKKGKKK